MNDDDKPILFLDVDGPLNPYAAKPHQRPDGYQTIYLDRTGTKIVKRGFGSYYRVWYNPDHGQKIKELQDAGFNVIWATKWKGSANDILNPLYGLDPFVVAPVSSDPEAYCNTFYHKKDCLCLHSKTKTLVDFADGVPFIWVDDELRQPDRDYANAHCPQPHFLYRVFANVGLKDADFDFFKDWIKNLSN